MHGRGRGRGRFTLNIALIVCFHCHKLGHYQYECPEVGKRAYYASSETTAKAEEEFLVVAYGRRWSQQNSQTW